MKDTFTIGSMAGVIAIVIIQVISMLLVWLGVIDMTILDVAVALFLAEAQAGTAAGITVGVVTHLVAGGGGGVVLAYLIKLTGRDFYWLKGLALGGAVNLLLMGFAVSLLDLVPHMREDAVTMLVHILEQFLYGLIAAYIIVRFGRFAELDI